LNLGIREMGWELDWKRFRVYLKEKYAVEFAYMFMGYLPENQNLYRSLQKQGFVLVFKEVLVLQNGKVKGNCDAELVLQAMIDYSDYERAVIVSGDGDFACLAKHLLSENKLEKLLVPNKNRFSALLKKSIGNEKLDFMNNLKNKLSYIKEKHPVRTKP
jgi:uncharacterized LabA/DUF88 family protein